MKKCELCNGVARMYCDSDRAILCWDCDTTVHTANFLVAKHSRTLLCHACQSPTPWTGSGPKLGPTVSVCETCVRSSSNRSSSNSTTNNNSNYENSRNEDEEEEEEEEDDDDDSSESDEDEDNGDNQVVPLCSRPEPLPLVLGSSSSEESSSSRPHSCRDDKPKSIYRVFF